MNPPTKPIKTKPVTLIEKIGIKNPDEIFHDRIRMAVYIIVIGMLIWSFWNDQEEVITLDDFNNQIKEGTLLYQTIDQLDEDTQQKYLRSLKKALDDNQPTLVEKYTRALRVALMAGILSEYMIHGNMAKPMAIVGKTVLFTLVATTLN